MEIRRDGVDAFLVLGESCTIVDVEEHTEHLRQQLAGDEPVSRLHVDAGHVTELDTAYLQLLLMAQEHMKKIGGQFSVRRASPCLLETLACYGLKL